MEDINLRKNLSRRAILLQLQAAYPAAVSDEILMQGLKICGANLTEKQFAQDIEYLCELGLARRAVSAISAGLKRSKLTAEGIKFLEGEGF